MHNSKQYETIGLQDSGQLIACWTRCTVWSIHSIHSSSRFPSIGRSVQLLHGGFREPRVTGGGRGESAQMAQEFTPPPAPGGGRWLCALLHCASYASALHRYIAMYLIKVHRWLRSSPLLLLLVAVLCLIALRSCASYASVLHRYIEMYLNTFQN